MIDEMSKKTKGIAKDVFENPHVHRCSSYICDLKRNWAYVGTTRQPKFRCAVDQKKLFGENNDRSFDRP